MRRFEAEAKNSSEKEWTVPPSAAEMRSGEEVSGRVGGAGAVGRW